MDNIDNMTSGNRYHGDIIVTTWLHATIDHHQLLNGFVLTRMIHSHINNDADSVNVCLCCTIVTLSTLLYLLLAWLPFTAVIA